VGCSQEPADGKEQLEGMMTAYDEAQAELARIDAMIAEWQQKRDTTQRALLDVNAHAPTRILQGQLDPATFAKQAVQLEDELTAINGVITAVQAQRRHAERQVEHARIADLRVQAQRLRQEAEPILKRREALLADLQALEGELYMHAPRSHHLLAEAQRLEDRAFDLELRLHAPPRERDAQGNEIRRYAAAVPEATPAMRYESSIR
jgi:hypothetical protein